MKQVRFENKMEERGQGWGEQGREATRDSFGVISIGKVENSPVSALLMHKTLTAQIRGRGRKVTKILTTYNFYVLLN